MNGTCTVIGKIDQLFFDMVQVRNVSEATKNRYSMKNVIQEQEQFLVGQ